MCEMTLSKGGRAHRTRRRSRNGFVQTQCSGNSAIIAGRAPKSRLQQLRDAAILIPGDCFVTELLIFDEIET